MIEERFMSFQTSSMALGEGDMSGIGEEEADEEDVLEAGCDCDVVVFVVVEVVVLLLLVSSLLYDDNI